MAGQNPVSRFGRTLRGQDLHLSCFVQTPDLLTRIRRFFGLRR